MKNKTFGIDSYNYLLDLIIKSNRAIINFNEAHKGLEGIIIRHDVDFSPDKAHSIALVENKKNINSTFFFLVNTELYDIKSSVNINFIKNILLMGHKIGLHFDPGKNNLDMSIVEQLCEKQIAVLENLIDIKIDIISFHRPENRFIGMNNKLNNKLHTYMPQFITNINYCSDSGGVWKYDDPEELINNKNIKSVQLLTHPIWWTTPDDLSPGEKIAFHLKSASDNIHLAAAINCLPYKTYLQKKGNLEYE